MQTIRICLLATIICLVSMSASQSAEPQSDFQHLPPAAEAILAKPDRFELLSLDPGREGEKTVNGFHDWKVLGSTIVSDAKTQRELVAALKKGISENEGIVAACFNPRHGLRVTQGDKTVDIVICFECLSMSVYIGEQKSGVWTTRSPQPVFDKVLRDAQIPLAEKPNSD
jgi:hypothetical protein